MTVQIKSKMTHDYRFKCNCEKCVKITKHFNLKSEYHAKFLGYQID